MFIACVYFALEFVCQDQPARGVDRDTHILSGIQNMKIIMTKTDM